jgi:hypothetical protein
MSDVPLTDQLACARRELALRRKVYTRLVAMEAMLSTQAARELAAMEAIVQTLERLVEAEAAARQPALFPEAPDG